MTRDPRILAIDLARTIHLGGGWRATVAIDPDGDETCWLVSPTPQLLTGCACRACAPHDQLTSSDRTTRTGDPA